MKIVRYTNVSGNNPTTLTQVVENWMKQGWQPFGSPYLWCGLIVQMLVKYE